MTRPRPLRSCFFSALVLLAPASLSEVDSQETLDSVRQDAMRLIQSGQRLEAAQLLLETLGSLPPDRADLAYPAIGCFQLLAFTNEYLMSEEECIALYDQSLHEDTNDMHRLIAILMRYMDDGGMNQEESNECARGIQELTVSKHQAVRLAALFVMSSPYYYYDTKLGQQARDRIAAEFPNSHLAQEAQRLNLYYARKDGGAGLKEALERTDDNGELRAHSLRMQADAVGGAVYQAVRQAGDLDAACVAGLASEAARATDWAEEYAALNVLDGFHNTVHAQQVQDAASRAMARDRDPRCTFRALTMRMNASRILGDMDSLTSDANTLLSIDQVPAVAERNNYEEFRNSIQHAANSLAEAGRTVEACAILERLAKRFPDTLLSRKVRDHIAKIQSTRQPSE